MGVEFQSERFYCWRMFAILSIVLAHSAYAIPNSPLLTLLFARLGAFGVIVFLIAAGFYFNREKYHSLKILSRKKIVSLGIPWLVWGSVVWCIVKYSSGEIFDIGGWVLWLLGQGTYLWFFTVVVCCFVGFLYLPAQRWVYGTVILISLFSNLLTAMGVLNHLPVNLYLNVFNWIGYFALGVVLRSDHTLEKVEKSFLRTWKSWIIALAVIILSLVVMPVAGYKSIWTPYVGIAFAIITWNLTGVLYRFSVLNLIGQWSLAIYLLHMPLIGQLNHFGTGSIAAALLRPVIAVGVLVILLALGKWLAKKLHCMGAYEMLLGIH